MEYGILGPLEVVDRDRALDLGSPRQRALLALLLIHANRTLTTDRILDELWGDRAEGKENALWVYISRLRSVLEPDRPARGHNTVLITRDHGYALTVDPQAIDSARFEAQVALGREQLKDDPAAASRALAGALALWRGDALQDFAYDDFARAERERLEELRLTATGDRIDADLRAGRARELVGELEGLHRRHPVRERFVGQLMRALYQAGRHLEALRVFERFRRQLRDEAGLDPSPELRRLEEQVLVQDPRLDGPGERASAPVAVANPFRGLRAFGEHDVARFHGREQLVADVLRRIADGAPLIALVGASGSGKSSVAGAGVVPAIRKQQQTGAGGWVVAWMVPGAHPFVELEAALRRAALDPPDDLGALVSDPAAGMLRAVLGVLPDADGRLLMVIDQFEELFSLVEDDAVRDRFLDQLVTVIDDPRRRTVVVITLRADFYSLPLHHPEFGARLGDGVVNVVPLRPDELETAAQAPARHVGVRIEPALLAALLTDVVGRPGTLPLFQYALTELFERRDGDALTLSSYHDMGAVSGAVGTRADDLFARLTGVEQAAAMQVFLRLVAIAERDAWTRRRTAVSEIAALPVDIVALERVLDVYARHRLLTLDRDEVTGAPTVEVAHEALLTHWGRLHDWIERARDDIRRRAVLVAAMTEWQDADRDADYLLAGTRLADYERWASTATLQLTSNERAYLDASVRHRDDAAAREAAAVREQQRLAMSARRRLWAIAAMVGLLLAAAAVTGIRLFGVDRPRVVVAMPSASDQAERLIASGLDRAADELGVDVQHLRDRTRDPVTRYRQLADEGADVVVIDPEDTGFRLEAMVAAQPDTQFAVIGAEDPPAPVRDVRFVDEQAGYLAGVAAGTMTETRAVGFVGDAQHGDNERLRAGFEAGVHSVDRDVTVHATYVGEVGTATSRTLNRANTAADQLYQRGADIVFAAVGAASTGVFEAALDHTLIAGRDVWAIGAGQDWNKVGPASVREQVRASVMPRWDVAVLETIRALIDDTPATEPIELTAPSGALALVDDGTPRVTRAVDSAIDDIRAERVTVPTTPVGSLNVAPSRDVTDVGTVTWDGDTCEADVAERLAPGTVGQVALANEASTPQLFVVDQVGEGTLITTVVPPRARAVGYAVARPGEIELGCSSAMGERAGRDPPPVATVTVGAP